MHEIIEVVRKFQFFWFFFFKFQHISFDNWMVLFEHVFVTVLTNVGRRLWHRFLFVGCIFSSFSFLPPHPNEPPLRSWHPHCKGNAIDPCLQSCSSNFLLLFLPHFRLLQYCFLLFLDSIRFTPNYLI